MFGQYWGKRARGLLLALMAALSTPSALCAFQDPLETPAQESRLASSTALVGVARAGGSVVAVGRRGTILVSADGGHAWRQAAVPVSSDLVAVHFPSPQQGWAVGHDGVVLHTRDGGYTWSTQLDGRRAAALMLSFYEERAGKGDEGASKALEKARRFAQEGPVEPFLDVWFQNDKIGYIVGAFNLIFRTDDGGKTWQPWLDRTENPNELHLYAVRGAGDQVLIVGEQGLVLRLDPRTNRFAAIPSFYDGTLFGLVARDSDVVVFGMRGNAFHSADGGKIWKKVDTGARAGLTGGAMFDDGRILLVSQGGGVLVSTDGGATFAPAHIAAPMQFAGIAQGSRGDAVLVGTLGVRSEALRTMSTGGQISGR